MNFIHYIIIIPSLNLFLVHFRLVFLVPVFREAELSQKLQGQVGVVAMATWVRGREVRLQLIGTLRLVVGPDVTV